MRERFDRIAYIRRGLEQDGATLQQLAYQLGLSRQRVAAIADDAGITARARMDCSHRLPQYHTEATLLRARALWDDGHSASQIGRRLTEEIGRRITKNAVIGIAHRNDFPPPLVADTIMSNFDWNEATTQRLRDLWVQIPQLSTAEIGRHLGCGKCAVCGKAHRLKLDARPSPILYSGSEDPYARRRKTEKPLREAPRAPRVTLAPLASVAALAPVPAPSLVRIQEPKSRPVAVRAPSLCLVVSILRCCRPLNDGRPWKFCNKPVETAGRQYCDECHDACYVKVRDRREDVVA